ncbi:MAG: 2-hydroxyglutaryl-CoA dehydratase [Ruminococcaceae bacterium]|nr:2-hydroxyglutaryl-CoA dehydratase [Oscillospiraceae bacterium]
MTNKTNGRIEFTKEMKKTHKILFPNMCNIHFKILRNIFAEFGYNVELLENDDDSVIETGLKYVHNDTCYPALVTIGQMISALESGKYDLDRTALAMTQTGGGCRASNYIHLLRKALKKAGLGNIPVISLNISGLEKNSGFKITLPLLRRALAAVTYGDMLMLLSNQTEPYEVTCGETKSLTDKWIADISDMFKRKEGYRTEEIKSCLSQIVESFSCIKTEKRDKVRVGIVGEIFVKYSATANNNLERFLKEQGCEVMVPGLLGFLLFKVDNRIEDIKLYGGNIIKKAGCGILLDFFSKYEEYIAEALRNSKSGKFVIPSSYAHLKELIGPVLGRGCKMGEGWLLTAEMMELIELGYGNIVCTQPFGCLPNHIVGKGMIRKLSEMYPEANIVPIDYDPGATKVNQENRIKLMLSVAREKSEK